MEFFKCLNMASLWKLPGVYMLVESSHAVKDVAKKAVAFNIPVENVDRQDVFGIREVIGKWVNYARQWTKFCSRKIIQILWR